MSVQRLANHEKISYTIFQVHQNCTISVYDHMMDVNSESLLFTTDLDPTWLLQDATFEKMGVLMAENNGRLLGMYDELSAFLTKIKLYSNRGLSDSHELAMFLEFYNANPWTRTTGINHEFLIFFSKYVWFDDHL